MELLDYHLLSPGDVYTPDRMGQYLACHVIQRLCIRKALCVQSVQTGRFIEPLLTK